MIEELKNPLTREYLAFKNEIFTTQFPWYWNEDSVINDNKNESVPFLGHSILQRPCDINEYFIFPNPNSTYTQITNIILDQIFQHNKINLNCVFRINVNLTIPIPNADSTKIHVDHEFPHKNLLIYLNNSDGNTILCDENDNDIDLSGPKEDKIILFEGKHYHYLPSKSRRVVLVCTFM
jgi:hypothetical protein